MKINAQNAVTGINWLTASANQNVKDIRKSVVIIEYNMLKRYVRMMKLITNAHQETIPKDVIFYLRIAILVHFVRKDIN